MKITAADELQWASYPGQRSPTITYKPLLKGTPGTPENYELTINSFGEGGSFSPRHRHNFEQFRYALGTPLNYSPGLDIPPGQIGFFPEGAYYGPQTIVEGSLMLIVQFGGASGSGYLSVDQLMQGTNELRLRGEFNGGVYTTINAAGKRTNQDGHEAVWQYVSGHPVHYPAPRYREPIIIQPEAFQWSSHEGQPGVDRRLFGVFNERGASASQYRLAQGATLTLPSTGGSVLVFLDSGQLEIEATPYSAYTAIEVSHGETATLTALEDSVLLTFTMSDFSLADGGAEHRSTEHAA